jgi:dihydroorotate dehydrogenase
MYRQVLKPFLFRMDPEHIHHKMIGALKQAGKFPGGTALLQAMYGVKPHPELETELWGIQFPHPVGLAAGLDKNGQAVPAFSSVGFGFMEVGTVTPKGQPGNDMPRLFRLPPDEALINRMGFNNAGADEMVKELASIRHRPIPVAVNIGKNKDTPNEQAVEDYVQCIRTLYDYANLFVVNISSPNTPGLRNLQHGDELRALLAAVTEEMDTQKRKRSADAALPILVKIAPDMDQMELEQVVETISSSRISGIIATNTTLSREGLTHSNASETGGLSGKPLTSRSTEVIRSIYKLTEGKLPIIGSGGIFTAEDAYDKIRAGASLVEIYTSLIYKGPEVNRELAAGLLRLLRRDGFSHISQAVGTEAASS